jgi:hypothetical protein
MRIERPQTVEVAGSRRPGECANRRNTVPGASGHQVTGPVGRIEVGGQVAKRLKAIASEDSRSAHSRW